MKIYWTLKRIPELRSEPWRERGRRWRRAYSKCFRHFVPWAALLLPAFGGVLGSYYGEKFDSGMLGAVLGGAIGGFLFGQIVTAFARKHYRHVLLGKDAEQSAAPRA